MQFARGLACLASQRNVKLSRVIQESPVAGAAGGSAEQKDVALESEATLADGPNMANATLEETAGQIRRRLRG